MDKRLTAGIAVVITAAWAVSFLVTIINPHYDPPASVHVLMTVVAGAAFGGSAFQRAKEVATKAAALVEGGEKLSHGE